MSDWQERFTEHTTGVAFQISLSANMIGWLAELNARGSKVVYGYFNGAVLTPLERRGLIERQWRADHTYRLKVTPAGKQVLALIELAGIVPDRRGRRLDEQAA